MYLSLQSDNSFLDLDLSSRVIFRKRNVDSLLEPSPDCGVQDPRNVGGTENENAIVVVAHALHLD